MLLNAFVALLFNVIFFLETRVLQMIYAESNTEE